MSGYENDKHSTALGLILCFNRVVMLYRLMAAQRFGYAYVLLKLPQDY